MPCVQGILSSVLDVLIGLWEEGSLALRPPAGMHVFHRVAKHRNRGLPPYPLVSLTESV